MIRRGLRLLALATAVLCTGCGYQVLGRSGTNDRSGRLLWAAPVEDDAAEPLFGVRLGQHLSREAVDAAGFTLASRERAELVLRVRVARVAESGAAFVVGDLTREYRLTAVAEVYLTRPDGEILWKGNVSVAREFPAGANVNQTEANKSDGLNLLARDLGREVLRRAAVVTAGIVP